VRLPFSLHPLSHITCNVALAIGSSKKRKRDTVESNDDEDHRSERLSDADDVSSPDENEHENYGAQKPPKAKPATLSKKRSKPKATRRTRVAKDGELKEPSRKSKKPQTNGDASNANKIPQDFKINTDNPLFSTCLHPSHSTFFTHTSVKDAIMNPSAALQLTVEDFLESLRETPGPAQAELVNCILRACGCNDSVNQDEAVDYDGVVDALDNFTEALKQVRWTTLVSLLLNISFLRMIRPYIP
jgi:cohesin complex subunit SA-1/2